MRPAAQSTVRQYRRERAGRQCALGSDGTGKAAPRVNSMAAAHPAGIEVALRIVLRKCAPTIHDAADVIVGVPPVPMLCSCRSVLLRCIRGWRTRLCRRRLRGLLRGRLSGRLSRLLWLRGLLRLRGLLWLRRLLGHGGKRDPSNDASECESDDGVHGKSLRFWQHYRCSAEPEVASRQLLVNPA
jgi:hypothetical protein